MANALEKLFTKRRVRSPISSNDLRESLDAKKAKNFSSSDQSEEGKLEEDEEDEILTALGMSGEVANQFKTILKKLEKLDSIKESLKSIQASLKSLEQRMKRLEAFHASAKEGIREMKESLNNHD